MCKKYITADPFNYRLLHKKAKEHRKNPTEAERCLWECLRRKFSGFKFRRQHIIGNYIVDFVCLSKQIVIETDGEYHYTEQQCKLDQDRTRFLNNAGFKVIRFRNEEILHNTDNTLKRIKETLNE